MKAKLLTLILFISSVSLVEAQCIPEQNFTDPGFYPEVLDTAYAGTNYEEVLQALVIKDTVVNFNGNDIKVIVDSAKVLEVRNMPTGFTYTCDRSDCIFSPDSVGCVLITGSPTANEIGVYQLEIDLKLFGRTTSGFPLTQTETLTDFQIVIEADPLRSPWYISHYSNLAPNPSRDGVFKLVNSDLEFVRAIAYDVFGRMVSNIEVSNASLDLGDLENGTYTVELITAEDFHSVSRVQIQK